MGNTLSSRSSPRASCRRRPGPDSSAADSRSPPRPRHRSSSRSRSRRRRRAHAHAGAQTRSDAREHGHSPGPRVPGGMSSGLSAMHHYASWLHGSRRAHPFRPAAGVTLGAWHTTPSALRASPASSPATSRVPAAERGPAQRALDRRLDHDAFRFRQPWSSRDQVMVLGPVAALLGGDKLGHRGRGPGGRRARRAVAGGPSTCRGCRRPLALRELGRAGAARRR